MKGLIFFCVFLSGINICLAQRTPDDKASKQKLMDSVTVTREVAAVEKLIAISGKQRTELANAVSHLNTLRRNISAGEIGRLRHKRDSAYEAALGGEAYRLYRERLYYYNLQKRAKQLAGQGIDTVVPKHAGSRE